MPDETFRWVIAGAVAISTLCILITAVVAIAMYRAISKLQSHVGAMTEDVGPLVGTLRKMADENSPRISAITADARTVAANAKDISEVAKDQAHRFAEVGRDLADRTKAQVARVDAAVDQAVEQVQDAGENIKASMLKPVREASAVLAGVRAAVSSYSQGRRLTIDHITQDEEMFI